MQAAQECGASPQLCERLQLALENSNEGAAQPAAEEGGSEKGSSSVQYQARPRSHTSAYLPPPGDGFDPADRWALCPSLPLPEICGTWRLHTLLTFLTFPPFPLRLAWRLWK